MTSRRSAVRIAIMGSGGVGGYVGARLQDAGADVVFIARGAHLEAMQASGLRLQHPQHPLHLPTVTATADPGAVGPVDLVLFCVKLGDTDAAARAMIPMLGPDTRVLTLQNGIDSVAMIERQAPGAIVRGGVIYVSAAIARPGVIGCAGGFHRVVADAAHGDPVMTAFHALGARAVDLDVEITDDLPLALWEKFITLTSLSGTTSLMRATMGQVLAHPETRAFQRQLVDEAVAVAHASGVAVRADFADVVMGRLDKIPPSVRSSMAGDLAAGKPLELRWLSGRVHGLGLEMGVPTPAHSAVFRGLVLYEQGAPT
jgi:2-dehydropantoate 2-reductase